MVKPTMRELLSRTIVEENWECLRTVLHTNQWNIKRCVAAALWTRRLTGPNCVPRHEMQKKIFGKTGNGDRNLYRMGVERRIIIDQLESLAHCGDPNVEDPYLIAFACFQLAHSGLSVKTDPEFINEVDQHLWGVCRCDDDQFSESEEY